jgi:AcrR family transcriptional regulator
VVIASTRAKRREYHSPARERQAGETRLRILQAARALLLRSGFAGTTIESIAVAAEVSPKTVTAIFGSKRGILAALLDPGVFGSRFQEVRGQLRTEPDPKRRVRLAARLTRQAYERLGPEFELLRGASAVAADLKPLALQVETRRRDNLARLVSYVADQARLPRGLTEKNATDVLLVLTSFDIYRTLVLGLGWPPVRYETWLGNLLISSLFQGE